MNETKNLSYAALEEVMQQLMDNAKVLSAYGPLTRDLIQSGTGVVQFSVINDPKTWSFEPHYIHIHSNNFWLAAKILRGAGWHHKHTARWRYLVRRGARK